MTSNPAKISIRRFAPGKDPLTPRPRLIIPRPSREIRDLLSEPTWSVRSMLPPTHKKNKKSSSRRSNTEEGLESLEREELEYTAQKEITPEKLRHLLRLSALPPPANSVEENKLLNKLRDHVHFVQAVQAVPTEGVVPLVTIRDETQEAIQEATVNLKDLQPYLDRESKVGLNQAVKRDWKVNMEGESGAEEREEWGVDLKNLGQGSERRMRGKYAFVRRQPKSPKTINPPNVADVPASEPKNAPKDGKAHG